MKIFLFPLLLLVFVAQAQQLQQLAFTRNDNSEVLGFVKDNGEKVPPPYRIPLISFELNKKETSTLRQDWQKQVEIVIMDSEEWDDLVCLKITFRNVSNDTINLRNVVPFGKSNQQVYITGMGDHWLSRTHLFIPRRAPVNVIVPDNAWELGYSGITLANGLSVFGLTRRKSWEKTTRKRFESIVAPGGTVTYELYADFYQGEWQEGLRRCFQERYLYDLIPPKSSPAGRTFNEDLFNRKDLQWIRDAYVMHLVMAWDNWFYDYKDGKYHLTEFGQKGKKLYGGDDVIGIWPTWPTLGLDQRNQWDLFRDLPGGLPRLKTLSEELRKQGTKLFICYNPWDESTQYLGGSKEGQAGHLNGMAQLIKDTGADGVVLDTKGSSSAALQTAADQVKAGVVMYSEGMAIPKDMLGIVSGRVHNALYYPPMLNLNKFMKPEFAIFRVAELYLEPIKREFATSFFNGYGTELNVFRNGKPAEWMDEQYHYLGRTSRILRENSPLFQQKSYTPLISTTREGIFVNHWKKGVRDEERDKKKGEEKELWTIFSIIPEGFKAPLFEVIHTEGYHFVDLWHHKELTPILQGGKHYIEAETEAFDQKWLGTNNEGSVDCIAKLPNLLTVSLKPHEDLLEIKATTGTIRLWAGVPDYAQTPIELLAGYHSIKLMEKFGRYEGRFVVQLFDGKLLLDERIVEIKPGTARLVSKVEKTKLSTNPPKEMVKIPAGKFTFNATRNDDWVFYPDEQNGQTYEFKPFLMDKNLVTNADFAQFLAATKYRPKDPINFLKHWKNGKIPAGLDNYPVVYVSYEDAQAYARWAGKRLPTEQEWQYAAQYPDNRDYPWGMSYDSTRCNPGNGKLDPVGSYSNGVNSLQINDLIGNVWQLTNDIYQNGSYTFVMLKGGSHFKPTASWWYVQGGPQKLTHRQHLLRVSEGFERNATVGFRCVKDID